MENFTLWGLFASLTTSQRVFITPLIWRSTFKEYQAHTKLEMISLFEQFFQRSIIDFLVLLPRFGFCVKQTSITFLKPSLSNCMCHGLLQRCLTAWLSFPISQMLTFFLWRTKTFTVNYNHDLLRFLTFLTTLWDLIFFFFFLIRKRLNGEN